MRRVVAGTICSYFGITDATSASCCFRSRNSHSSCGFGWFAHQHLSQYAGRGLMCTSLFAEEGLNSKLGPPSTINSLSVGECRKYHRKSDRSYTLERISVAPNAFLLRSFLSELECNEIMARAEQQGMAVAETRGEAGSESRKKCVVAWLGASADQDPFELESTLVKDVRTVLIQHDVAASSNLFSEYLQVLRYDKGGMYDIHHDGAQRFLTVIYYLNNNAATWFPFASLGEEEESTELQEQFLQIRKGVSGVTMNVRDDLQPGIDGVVVVSRESLEEEDLHLGKGRIIPIDQGDALAFYNFDYSDDDKSNPREDWRALHAGLPAEGTKMIANHWFRLICDD